ncbi:unnamed protein product [Bursaphelenchus okinawaensis]|uniref:Uncharacterized protein n=1 Tax=Bursaphelenchus okinawaensis TaxID=465554 RepID=A0A811KMJ4_9BILA|nr:unnamed protein product [Bursaphelenchus okinawaensis]CAG9107752.1 unnamed protein product [Bursaphelenchus okinawaensis]
MIKNSTRQKSRKSVDDFYARLRKLVSKLMPDGRPEETLEETRQRARKIESTLRRAETERAETAIKLIGSNVNAAIAPQQPSTSMTRNHLQRAPLSGANAIMLQSDNPDVVATVIDEKQLARDQ